METTFRDLWYSEQTSRKRRMLDHVCRLCPDVACKQVYVSPILPCFISHLHVFVTSPLLVYFPLFLLSPPLPRSTRVSTVHHSWGDARGNKGYFLMTDAWFEEYLFQVEELRCAERTLYTMIICFIFCLAREVGLSYFWR